VRNGFVAFWTVLGLAGLIVVGANVAVSLHRISTECAGAPGFHTTGGFSR
jgi:hypothetical protein